MNNLQYHMKLAYQQAYNEESAKLAGFFSQEGQDKGLSTPAKVGLGAQVGAGLGGLAMGAGALYLGGRYLKGRGLRQAGGAAVDAVGDVAGEVVDAASAPSRTQRRLDEFAAIGVPLLRNA